MATQDFVTQKVEFPTHERPSTQINAMLMTIMAVGIAFLVFAILFPFKGTFIRDLFMGREALVPDRMIFQGLTTFVWALSVASIILKYRRIREERGLLDDTLVPERLDFSNSEQVISVYERVRAHPRLVESLGLTRVARVLAMWINTNDFERTAQYAREEGDLDAFASDSSYRAARLYIWAMPLLGFVGTVYGVSYGISGFAEFLRGSAVTAEQIKVQVGLITEGLAVAFYCTLLGLVTAGLAAFPTLFAERNEEDAIEEINEFVEDRLISQMPSTAAQQRFPMEELANAVSQGMASVQAQTKFPIDELAQAIDAGFRRLPNPDRYEEVFTRAVTKAADLINQKYDEFAQNYERRVGELGSQLGGKLEAVGNAFQAGTQRMSQQTGEQTQRLVQGLNEQTDRMSKGMVDIETRQTERMNAIVEELRGLAESMPEEFRKAQDRYLDLQGKTDQKAADRFDELTEQLTTLGKEQAEQFGEAHERYLEALTDLDKKELARWEKMVSEFNQLASRMADQFKQAVAGMDSASTRYSERIQGAVESLNEQLTNVQQLGQEIDKVLRTTQSMEATLRQVGSSDEFRQTLSTLRNHLVSSDELLKQLSRPRKVVFQEARADE